MSTEIKVNTAKALVVITIIALVTYGYIAGGCVIIYN